MSKFCSCPCLPPYCNMDQEDGARKRSISYPGAESDWEPPLPANNRPTRARSQTESELNVHIMRKKRSVRFDRRRSVSDPPNGVSKFLKNFGLRYFQATLANLTRNSPKIDFMRESYDDLPVKNVAPISCNVLSAYSAPSGGLTNIKVEENGEVRDESEKKLRDGDDSTSNEEDSNETESGHQLSLNNSNRRRNESEASRAAKWNLRKVWAYGIVLSLYEDKGDDSKECTGDPIADVIAIKTTENSAILGLADGCGWGYGSRRAARCAIKGSMDYIAKQLYSSVGEESAIKTTADIFRVMRDSIDEGQKLVIGSTATLTTLVLSVVTQLANSKDFVVCTVNIGDSLAYVFNEEYGVRELTVGCRDMESHRNIRFCDGALGPALGDSPDLTNMTFSISVVKKGDIVFLTSDGISDNFDPVIAGRAEASPEYSRRGGRMEPVHNGGGDETEGEADSSKNEKPVFSPRDRQEQTEYEMTEILKNTDIPNEDLQSAQVVCSKLLQYVVDNTEKRRQAQKAANTVVIERAKHPDHRTVPDHPDNTIDGMRKYLRTLPGKLDHASVVAYVVGMHGIEEEEEEKEEQKKEKEIIEIKERKENLEKEVESGNPEKVDPSYKIN